MKSLDENVVHLSCAEEISAGYVSYRAREESFSVSRPYQAVAAPLDVASGLASSGTETSLPARRDDKELASSPEQSASAGRKRKRVSEDTQRAAREHEAQKRHLEIHDHLLRAHLLHLQWFREQENVMSNQLEAQQHSSQQDLVSSPQKKICSSSAEGQEKLDLISLSHMKRAIRPKFTFTAGDAYMGPRNLFDQIISNDSNQDQIADAAGHAVVIPPRSRFMIADITRLKPLLAGWCLSALPFWEQ